MFPLRDNLESKETPYVTFALIALNVFIYLWDRNWTLFGPSVVFPDLAMRPEAIVKALKGQEPGSLLTLFTCMFLHGSLLHIFGNMVFLLVFGTNVEHALGGIRFAVLYLLWGLAASAVHIFVDPASTIPTLGASGAIGGVLGCYFLLFPGNRVSVWIYFVEVALPAWVLLGIWFVWQVLFPQAGVANWAHVGGFVAGMLSVLLLGGRSKVLEGVPLKRVPDEEWEP